MQSFNFWIAPSPIFLEVYLFIHVISTEVNTNPIIYLPIYQDPILLCQRPNPFANSTWAWYQILYRSI